MTRRRLIGWSRAVAPKPATRRKTKRTRLTMAERLKRARLRRGSVRGARTQCICFDPRTGERCPGRTTAKSRICQRHIFVAHVLAIGISERTRDRAARGRWQNVAELAWGRR